jgi:DNA-binding GntR family transcriptional regulator
MVFDPDLGDSQSAADASTEPVSLGHQAYRVLRRALRDGLIYPGRNYSESEFAAMLGVSRTPVREALKVLESEGVLQATRRRGYRLRTFTTGDIEELTTIRRALERISVSTFIGQRSEVAMSRLADVLSRQDADIGGTQMFLDEEFHLMIAHLAGLTRTCELLRGLRSAVAAVTAGASVPLSVTRKHVDEHHSIFDAIAANDVDAALHRMDRHIACSTQALLDAVASRPEIDRLAAPVQPAAQ